MTNLGQYKIETCPELWQIIDNLNRLNTNDGTDELPEYTYPDCVITPIKIGAVAKYVSLKILPEQVIFTRALDAQKEYGKTIYGCGFLSDEKAAAEKAAAEKAAAERRESYVWQLSDREKELVAGLGKR